MGDIWHAIIYKTQARDHIEWVKAGLRVLDVTLEEGECEEARFMIFQQNVSTQRLCWAIPLHGIKDITKVISVHVRRCLTWKLGERIVWRQSGRMQPLHNHVVFLFRIIDFFFE